MDNSNGHGGSLAQGVYDGEAQAYEAIAKRAQEGEHGDGSGEDAQKVEESWGDPSAYTGANRSTTPTRAEVENELAILSRGPFQRILADYLGFSPTPAALRRFADKSPDKWAAALGVLADLSGYKKGVMEVNNIMMIGSMDDAALHRRLKELEGQVQDQQRLITGQEQAQPPRELAPSRDSSIIDVQAKKI